MSPRPVRIGKISLVLLLAALACAALGCESKDRSGKKSGKSKDDSDEPAATKADKDKSDSPKKATGNKPEGAACQAVCSQAKKVSHIACVEGQLEELGFEMDADACDEWENVVAMGGDSCAQLAKCQKAEKFTNEHCGKVKAACFK
ncbi:MAG: hypothetical protein JRI68_06650 [Deltaproteobacteria bacterium]|nr:hypothetical protein [Deltaproteobacteria bacterium]